MPPAMYYTVCKICGEERGGFNLDTAVRVINKHLMEKHRILWCSSTGKDLQKLVSELKKIISPTQDYEGVIEEVSVIHDKVEKTWVLITPLFEITPTPPKIKREEQEEAKRLRREIKERRKALSHESKRMKYRRKYHNYHIKYYKDYLESKSLHTLQNLLTNANAEHMQLWYEYHSLRPFIDSLSSNQLERLREVSKELKKLDARPPTAYQLLKMELEEASSL